MKKTLLTLALAIASLATIAQDNAVKLNLSSLALGTGYISYERALSASKSVTLGVNYTSMGLPSSASEIFENDDQGEGTVDLSEPTLKGFGITAEYRMYTSKAKDGLAGFYVAPFLRHSQYTIGTETIFEKDNGDEFIGKQSIKLINSIGAGFVIGSHFNIGSHVSIDISWFGLGLTASKLKGKITTDDKTVDFRTDSEDIKQEVEENEYLTDVTIEQNEVQVSSVGFLLPIVRGNIAIGFRF